MTWATRHGLGEEVRRAWTAVFKIKQGGRSAAIQAQCNRSITRLVAARASKSRPRRAVGTDIAGAFPLAARGPAVGGAQGGSTRSCSPRWRALDDAGPSLARRPHPRHRGATRLRHRQLPRRLSCTRSRAGRRTRCAAESNAGNDASTPTWAGSSCAKLGQERVGRGPFRLGGGGAGGSIPAAIKSARASDTR